jgi:cyanate permease
MALGGWMSGKVFDLTGSYHAAFVNGVLWNALNLSIVVFLLWRTQAKKRRNPFQGYASMAISNENHESKS